MSIDISALSATELEQLIARAAERRSSMKPAMPGERPNTAKAIVNPAWYVHLVPEGTLFQIGHPGFGWLSFLIPVPERAHLMALLLQQSILGAPQSVSTAMPAATSAPVAGGGGKLH